MTSGACPSCGLDAIGERHGSRMVSRLALDDDRRVVRRPVRVERRRCRTCGTTWSDETPTIGGVRMEEALARRVVVLATTRSTRAIEAHAGVPRDAVAKVVAAHMRTSLRRGRIRPPFIVRRVGPWLRIVDADGVAVEGDAMFLEQAGAACVEALRGPFLCDGSALARLRILDPGRESYLHRRAIDEEARRILAIAVDRASYGDAGRVAAVRRFGADIQRRLTVCLWSDAPCGLRDDLPRIAERLAENLPGAAEFVRLIRSGVVHPSDLWRSATTRAWCAAGLPLVEHDMGLVIRRREDQPARLRDPRPTRVTFREGQPPLAGEA